MMKLGKPGKLVRRIAALGLLVLTVLTIYSGVVTPVVAFVEDNRQNRATLKKTLERYTNAAHELPRLQTRLAALEGNRHMEAGYLSETNETLAAAALQSRVKASVLQSGGQLYSMENMAPAKDGELSKVAVRARAAMELTGLQQVFIALNETTPILLFESLEIRTEETRREGSPDTLDVEFTVYGYLGGAKQ
jgi:hypothetical protein